MNQYELKMYGNSPEVLEKTKFLDAWYKGKIPARQRLWHIDNQCFYLIVCPICKCQLLNWFEKDKEYRHHCSSKCAHNDIAVTNKTKNTCMERFGSTSNYNSETHREIYKNKCIELYGVDNYAKTPEFKENQEKYWMEKCGYKIYWLDPKNIEKSKNTIIERYDREFSNQVHIPKHIIEMKNNEQLMRYYYEELKMTVSEIAEMLGIGISQLCVHFKEKLGINIHRHIVSKGERDMALFLSDLGEIVTTSNKKLARPKEIDIFIEDKHLAVEVNGLAWHCESRGKDNKYHIGKTNSCKDNEVRLIHIMDIDWNNRPDVVKSLLKRELNYFDTIIDSKECELKLVDLEITEQFFQENHIAGKIKGTVNIGLYFNNELVMVTAFNKTKILRVSYKNNFDITGGLEKIINYYILEYKQKFLEIKIDLRWDSKEQFDKLGFIHLRMLKPDFAITKPYKKLWLRSEKKENWKKLKEMGFDRIFDCGYELLQLKINN